VASSSKDARCGERSEEAIPMSQGASEDPSPAAGGGMKGGGWMEQSEVGRRDRRMRRSARR
jgi:hypothetical protein